MRLVIGILCCLFMGVSGPVEADVRFERISVKDGLSQSSVFALARDSRGFLWVATERAADRYDGHDFEAFRHRPGEPDSLSDSTVRAFYNDRKGGLWIGTDNGINRFDPASGRMQQFLPDGERGASQLQVLEQGIVENCRGDILFLSRDGVKIIPGGKAHLQERKLEGRQNSRLRGAILSDRNGGIWVADGRHLWFKPCRGESFRVADRLSSSAARPVAGPNALALAADGALLWASGDGLRRYDPGSGERISIQRPSDQGLPADTVDAVAVDVSGDLWLAMPKRIVRILHNGEFSLPQWQVMAEFDNPVSGIGGVQRLQVARSGDGLTWVAGISVWGSSPTRAGGCSCFATIPAIPSRCR
jgi:ligand-binding sensor domain-containing protein